MTGLEDVPLDTPLKLHKYAIDCLENELNDMTGLLGLIVDEEETEHRLDTKQNELLRGVGNKSGLILYFENVEEYFLLDLDGRFVVLEIPQELRKDLVEKQ